MSFVKLSSVFLSVVLAACGGSSRPAATTPTTNEQAAGDPSCPVAVAGTSVTVEDSATGAALVFVTTGDVAEVRRRATALASMHNDQHGKMGALPDGSSGGGGHTGHDTSHHAGHGGEHAGHSGSHAGHDMSGHAGGGEHAGHAGGMIGVHSKATSTEIEGGAKVSFVANGGDVAKLQSELRMHAQHLAAGTCAMGSS